MAKSKKAFVLAGRAAEYLGRVREAYLSNHEGPQPIPTDEELMRFCITFTSVIAQNFPHSISFNVRHSDLPGENAGEKAGGAATAYVAHGLRRMKELAAAKEQAEKAEAPALLVDPHGGKLV